MGGGSTNNGNAIQIWDCNGWDRQLWKVESGSIKYAKYPDKCIDIHGNGKNVGLKIWDCNGTPNQKISMSGGHLVHTDGDCVSMSPPGKAGNGKRVETQGCNVADKWRKQGSDSLEQVFLQALQEPFTQGTHIAMVAKNIVELAAGTADLSTLVTALKAGKLTDALSGKGPFTVFAPSNEAFAKLPKSVLDRLLDPKNIKELQDLLEYHVIARAAVHKADLKFTQRVKTLEGKELFIVKDHRGDVLVDNARVTTADVDASNGVVHIIDNVLIPRALDQSASPAVTKNIVELAAATADLSTLVTALKAGKLTDALSGKGPFTVFAPSNEAFAKLPKSVLDRLLDPKNIKELQDVLEYHVIAGAAVHKADLKSIQRVKTLEGKELVIFKDHHGDVRVGDAEVTTADVDASNGVVHIIDHVLLPLAVAASSPLPVIV